MKRTALKVLLIALLGIVTPFAGCNNGNSHQESAPPSGQSASDDEHTGHDHNEADIEKMNAELAKLSPEDAASAEKQHVCPVSGEMLGTMGPPLKVDVNGTQVWICCDGCREELLADPDKYLATLKKE